MADLIFAALDAPVPVPRGGADPGKFRASWADSLSLLRDELDKIDAKEPTLFVDVAPSGITRGGQLAGGITSARTPGVRLDFLKPTRRAGRTENVPASFPCARYWTAHHNVRAIALTLDALRAVDRYGATTEAGEQYTGFLRLPGPGGVNTTSIQLSPERAAKVLVEAHPEFREKTPMVQAAVAGGLLTMVASEAVAFAREARNAAHPDAGKGGTDQMFAAVNAAFEVFARLRGGLL